MMCRLAYSNQPPGLMSSSPTVAGWAREVGADGGEAQFLFQHDPRSTLRLVGMR